MTVHPGAKSKIDANITNTDPIDVSIDTTDPIEVSVEDFVALRDLIGELINQQKLTNLYLSQILGDELEI